MVRFTSMRGTEVHIDLAEVSAVEDDGEAGTRVQCGQATYWVREPAAYVARRAAQARGDSAEFPDMLVR